MADDSNNIQIKLQALDQLTPVMLAALQGMEGNSQKMAQALNGVKDSSDSTATSTEGLNGGIITLDATLDLAEKGVELLRGAFDALEEQMSKAIEASIAGEQANNQLTGSLVSTGQYTSALNDNLNEYAETLGKTAGANVDTTKQILASGVTMGLSTAQAKDLVSASQKLSAATGKDLQSSFQLLQQSLAGQSRGLSKVLPQIKELSTAQLQSGDAIGVVNASLGAQYELFQDSYSAGVARASTAIEELYKTTGDLITQNPAVKAAINEAAEMFNELGTFVTQNKTEIGEWVTAGVGLAINTIEILSDSMDALYRTGSASFHGLVGAVEEVGSGLLTLASGPMRLALEAIALLPGATGKAAAGAAESIDTAIESLQETAAENGKAALTALTTQTAASELVTGGLVKLKNATDAATASANQHSQALEQSRNDASANAAAMLKIQQTYDGIAYGNTRMQEQATREAAGRDADLKNFTTYLTNRERLAVSKAEEQQMAVNAIAAKATTGTGGEAGLSNDAQVAIDSETKKQATLKVLRDKGVLDSNEYGQAMLTSQQKVDQQSLVIAQAQATALANALGQSPEGFAAKQSLVEQQQQLQISQAEQFATAQGATVKQQEALETQMRQQFYVAKLASEKTYNQQEITLATAHEKQLADLLGDSPAGFQKKQQVAAQQFNMEQQVRKQEGQKEGLSEKQISDSQRVAQSEFETTSFNQRKAYYEEMANLQEVSGQTITATANAFYMEQEQAQIKSVNSFLSGVSIMKAGQSSLASTFDTIGQAMIKNQKMTSRQMAGAALEAFGTQVMETGGGLMALSIFPPDPLGFAAGAAEMAAGIAIGRVGSSMQGGQSDAGMDSIPQNLSGKSFILSAGERVVQPTANTDLTNFLASQKGANGQYGKGGPGGGITYQINVTAPTGDGSDIAKVVIAQIRKLSNQGQPIMSPKGLAQT